MNANNHYANRNQTKWRFKLCMVWGIRVTINIFTFRNQTVLCFQPRFGNIDINGRSSRWLHRDKGLLYLELTFGPVLRSLTLI